jgi:hypothetical protein
MAKKPLPFKQTDITRAVKGALAAGLKIRSCKIDRHGNIEVLAGEPLPETDNGTGNPWDKALAS